MTGSTKLFWIDMAAYGVSFLPMIRRPVVGLVGLYVMRWSDAFR